MELSLLSIITCSFRKVPLEDNSEDVSAGKIEQRMISLHDSIQSYREEFDFLHQQSLQDVLHQQILQDFLHPPDVCLWKLLAKFNKNSETRYVFRVLKILLIFCKNRNFWPTSANFLVKYLF